MTFGGTLAVSYYPRAEGGQGGGGGGGGGGKESSAADQAKKAAKAARRAHRALGPNIWWWVVTGVIVVAGIVHLLSLIRAWRIRRRVSRRLASQPTPVTSLPITTDKEKPSTLAHGASPSAATVPRAEPGVSTFIKASRALYNNYAYVRVFPLWIFSHSTAAEWWWTAAYTGITLGMAFWTSIFNGEMDIANPMGYAAFMQMPLIVGLASKNNVLSAITGISYEKLNYLHRASGRVCVLTTWIHWAAWVKKGLGRHGPGSEIFLTGVLGATALTLMMLTSFAIVRRVMYEFFLVVHILMGIIFIVAVYFHSPNRWFQTWVWPALFLWGLDRFVSFVKMIWINKAWLLPLSSKRAEHSACSVELVSPDVLRLHVRRPNFRWVAGQHAFIAMPGVAGLRYEQHPFTMSNIPDESQEAIFLIRAQTGFTRRLVNRLQSDKNNDINCYLEGPYGSPHDLNHYGAVLLVAGGTGVTYAVSQLASIIKASREGRSACTLVRLVWNVREEDATAWIAPMLNSIMAAGCGNVHVSIDIFVTRSHLADEPNADECPRLGGETEASPPETPMFSPGATVVASPSDSPKLSPRSSEDAAHEKTPNQNLAKAIRHGLTGPAAAAMAFHRGRSNVEMLLRTDIDYVPADAAGLAVGVCGPTSLMLDARRAVCKVNSASAVLKGQPPIDMFNETFGW